MNPLWENTFQVFTILLSCTSIGITILGWGFTGFMQLLIIGIQIADRRASEARQILFNQRLGQLEELRKWFQDGESNFRSRVISNRDNEQISSEIKEQFVAWKKLFGKAKVIAKVIDTAYPSYNKVSNTAYYWAVFNSVFDGKMDLPTDNILASYVDEFYELTTTDFSKKMENGLIAEEQIDEIFSKALIMLDNTATAKVPNQ